MNRIVELKFVNYDATPCVTTLPVTLEACRPICEWYGGFHAGDDYLVYIDNVQQKLGINGELL